MKVILLEDVKKQGKKGELIEVSDGYGKNFLIKNKKAVAYTSRSAEILNIQNTNQAIKEKEEFDFATKQKNELSKISLHFQLRENNGKFFGSISTKQIEKSLKDKGFEINRKKIEPKGGFHSLGDKIIKIKLHPKVVADVKAEISAIK